MTKKIRIRDKERTRQKLIKTVGKILAKEGHAALKINKIASVSGVNKKLIYDNFGSLDGLLKAYLQQVDFWKSEEQKMQTSDGTILPEITKDFMYSLLKSDFEYFAASKEMQKIVLWGISEPNKIIRALTDEREALGEKVFEKADPIFRDSAVDLRAVTGILVSAIYYMVLHARTNGSTICGIDLSRESGRHRILDAMGTILDHTYRQAEQVGG